VVAFDQGGVKEYLLNGECGILQVDQSPKAFAETLYDLLLNPPKLAAFSRNCLGLARKRTWGVVAREVIAVLNQFASDK
jgi:glycosyltransferase involved in cell wall biosynthesis